MGSHGRVERGNREGFIRIITPTILSEGKMVLEDKLVRKFGGEIGERASISVPSGDMWMVGVERIGRKQMMFNLKELMEFYRVKPYYLFIFTYNPRESNFSVVICGTSAVEIPYRRLLQITSSSTSTSTSTST